MSKLKTVYCTAQSTFLVYSVKLVLLGGQSQIAMADPGASVAKGRAVVFISNLQPVPGEADIILVPMHTRRNDDRDAAIKPGAACLREWLTTGEGRALLVERKPHILLTECGYYSKKIGGK